MLKLTWRSDVPFFPSRLCAAGVPRRPEADPHGGHEVPGGAASRQPGGSGCSAQDGDPRRGAQTSRRSAAQAEAPGHERPDAVGVLRSRDGVKNVSVSPPAS